MSEIETWLSVGGRRVCGRTERTHQPETMTRIGMGEGNLLITTDGAFVLPPRVFIRSHTGERYIHWPERDRP